jgi:hypothetical protein
MRGPATRHDAPLGEPLNDVDLCRRTPNCLPIAHLAITTLAILEGNYDRDRDFIGNYLPSVCHCLAASGGDVVSTSELQQDVVHEFGIELPQAVLRRVLQRAGDEGMVSYDSGV